MITKQVLQDANKIAYLIKSYPEKTVPEIIGMFQMPAVTINCAIWAAVELGFIEEMDQENQHCKLLKPPSPWDFGKDVQELEDQLTYAFEKLNAEEKDMEENYLASWTRGYFAHDILIATKQLLEDGVLHEYQIEDGDSNYIFYTLTENAGKNWGAKQFKVNPLTGENNPDAEQPEKKIEVEDGDKPESSS